MRGHGRHGLATRTLYIVTSHGENAPLPVCPPENPGLYDPLNPLKYMYLLYVLYAVCIYAVHVLYTCTYVVLETNSGYKVISLMQFEFWQRHVSNNSLCLMCCVRGLSLLQGWYLLCAQEGSRTCIYTCTCIYLSPYKQCICTHDLRLSCDLMVYLHMHLCVR